MENDMAKQETSEISLNHYRNAQRYDFEAEPNSESSDNEQDPNKSNKSARIFLRNLPKDLTENGIRNLCSQYGNIRYVKRFDYFAFVTYTLLR